MYSFVELLKFMVSTFQKKFLKKRLDSQDQNPNILSLNTYDFFQKILFLKVSTLKYFNLGIHKKVPSELI